MECEKISFCFAECLARSLGSGHHPSLGLARHICRPEKEVTEGGRRELRGRPWSLTCSGRNFSSCSTTCDSSPRKEERFVQTHPQPEETESPFFPVTPWSLRKEGDGSRRVGQPGLLHTQLVLLVTGGSQAAPWWVPFWRPQARHGSYRATHSFLRAVQGPDESLPLTGQGTEAQGGRLPGAQGRTELPTQAVWLPHILLPLSLTKSVF